MTKLLLHACCAPCSSGVVPQLEEYDITLLFYNPNIDTKEEFDRRANALIDYVSKYNREYTKDIKYIIIPYNHQSFLDNIQSLENEKEGGARCTKCIDLRLDYTGKYARDNGYDIFASTLSVSPHKNHTLINNLGEIISSKYNIAYLPNNFKKNNGFLSSTKNSIRYGLYRQNYCGCEFAKGHLKKLD